MTPTQKYFIDKLKEVNEEYKKELEKILLSLYHKVLHDSITIDDVCDIGERFNLDIEEEYMKKLPFTNDEESEDEY